MVSWDVVLIEIFRIALCEISASTCLISVNNIFAICWHNITIPNLSTITIYIRQRAWFIIHIIVRNVSLHLFKFTKYFISSRQHPCLVSNPAYFAQTTSVMLRQRIVWTDNEYVLQYQMPYKIHILIKIESSLPYLKF